MVQTVGQTIGALNRPYSNRRKIGMQEFFEVFFELVWDLPPAGGSGWRGRFASALSQFVYRQGRARKQADPERQAATKAELRAPTRSRMDSPATPCTETMKLPSGHALICLPQYRFMLQITKR